MEVPRGLRVMKLRASPNRFELDEGLDGGRGEVGRVGEDWCEVALAGLMDVALEVGRADGAEGGGVPSGVSNEDALEVCACRPSVLGAVVVGGGVGDMARESGAGMGKEGGGCSVWVR